MVKLALLDVVNQKFGWVTVKDIEDYHRFLNCSIFDVTTRKVGGRWFDIYCDDEGLFEPHARISALSSTMQVQLVGNLIFAHHDDEGNTTSITEEDFRHLENHVRYIFTINEEIYAMMNVDV